MQVLFILLLVIAGLLLLVIGWLLFARIVIRVDSENGVYELQMGGIVRLFYRPAENGFFLAVFGWEKKLEAGQKRAPAAKEKQARPRRRRIPLRVMLRKLRAVLRTFRVTRFELDLDTGDVITNAYLVPVFFFLSGKRRKLQVRYDGQSAILLEVNNRIVRIVRAVLFG